MRTLWWTELQLELERARRFRREFALLRVRRSGTGSGTGRPWRRKPPADVARFDKLQSSVRSIDTVWIDGMSMYILLPEASRGTALRVLERLRSETPEAFTDASVAVVAFPADALTAGALLDKLEERDRDAPRTVPVEGDSDLEADLGMSARRSPQEPDVRERAPASPSPALHHQLGHVDRS